MRFITLKYGIAISNYHVVGNFGNIKFGEMASVGTYTVAANKKLTFHFRSTIVLTYSTAHVKGKYYMRFPRGRHVGYTQVDYTCVTIMKPAGYTQHATHAWKSTPTQPTEVFVL